MSEAPKRSVAILGTRGYPSYYGGFETLLRHLVPYLAENGWSVTVYGRPGTTNLEHANANINISTIETRGLESKSLSTLTYGASSSINAARRKPDIALIMNVANGYWLPILRSQGVPCVVNVDGMEWERQKWGRLAKKVFKMGARLTARYADEIICDAVEIVRRWDSEFDRRGHFIPYGGTQSEVLPVPDGLVPGSYALMVARFVPENTVSEFFEAAKKISRIADVVIVGSSGYGGVLEKEIREISDQNSRIHWYGHVSDDQLLHSLWKHSGAYFHGHSVGGTNPALVQAMACGAPIVARNTVYNREVLGNSGVFVEPQANEIADRIISLLEDSQLQRELTTKAIMRSSEFYSWKIVCERYETLLRSMVEDDIYAEQNGHRDNGSYQDDGIHYGPKIEKAKKRNNGRL